MEVRYAHAGDVCKIIDLIIPYHEEAMFSHSRIPCDKRIFETVYGCVTDDWDALVAEHNGQIVGVLFAYQNHSFYKDDEMDIDFFYIHKDFRGTQAGRLLVGEIKKIALARDIAVIYCGCHSNMDDGGKNDKLFTNLFGKFGFKITGTNLHLKLKG